MTRRLLFNEPYASAVYAGIGEMMAQYGYNMIFHKNPGKTNAGRSIILKPELILRKSCGCGHK